MGYLPKVQRLFPESAKVASVTPVDKKIGHKISMSNFCPVNVLNCFLKVYENILKDLVIHSKYSLDFLKNEKKT